MTTVLVLVAAGFAASAASDPAPKPAAKSGPMPAWTYSSWVLTGEAVQQTFGKDPVTPTTERRSLERWEVTVVPAANGEDLDAVVTRAAFQVPTPFGLMVADTDALKNPVQGGAKRTNAQQLGDELTKRVGAGIGKRFTIDLDAQGQVVGVTGLTKVDGLRGPLERLIEPDRAAFTLRQIVPPAGAEGFKPGETWTVDRNLWEDLGMPVPRGSKELSTNMPVKFTRADRAGAVSVSWSGLVQQKVTDKDLPGGERSLELAVSGDGSWVVGSIEAQEVRLAERTEINLMFDPDKPVRSVNSTDLRWMPAEKAPAWVVAEEAPESKPGASKPSASKPSEPKAP